jgi:hypothetical protein
MAMEFDEGAKRTVMKEFARRYPTIRGRPAGTLDVRS